MCAFVFLPDPLRFQEGVVDCSQVVVAALVGGLHVPAHQCVQALFKLRPLGPWALSLGTLALPDFGCREDGSHSSAMPLARSA